MEYNTRRDKLKIKEYGRNVQKLIEDAAKIEDKEKRNNTAKAIVRLMDMITPGNKNNEDTEHKLWDHLQLIVDGNIDIESPYGKPEIEEGLKARPLPYPQKKMRFRHYGFNVESMVAKALEMTDKEKQLEFTILIGSYMKMVNRNAQKDVITDEVIIGDLNILSDGKLEVPPETSFDLLTNSAPPPKRSSNDRGRGRGRGGHSNNRGGSQRRRPRRSR
jgi:hypothetical protein